MPHSSDAYELVLKLIQQARGGAVDNLARANLAAAHQDASKTYGQSGQTLNEIIAEYQKRLDDVDEALLWFTFTGGDSDY